MAGETAGLMEPGTAAVADLRARPGAAGRRVLVLGTGPLARQVVREIRSRRRDTLFGMVAAAREAAGAVSGVPIVGSIDDLDDLLDRTRPERIIAALDDRRGRLPVQALLRARVRGTVVEDGADVLERLTGKIAIESVTAGSLAFGGGFRGSRLHDIAARLLGILAAAGVLVAGAPLMALVALLIKLDSRGPVLFVQERAGLGGRRFGLIKFRTMHPERTPASAWVRDNRHRITRVGRWLRRFHLDELPQCVNVLRGDMHLVGPRPHPQSNVDRFARRVPYYWIRSQVRPGVTGWAQVRHGYANDLEEETEKMRYDLYYIKHRSLRLDLRILIETLGVVCLGRGVESARPSAALPETERALPYRPSPS